MPGVASIRWTEENVVQAFYALNFYGAIKIEDDVAERVAAHFGNGCTTTAIHNLLRTRKASFKPGVLPSTDDEASPAKGRKRKNANETAAASETPKKARKITKKAVKFADPITPDMDIDNEDDFQEEPLPPVNEEEEKETGVKVEEAAGAFKTEE